MFRNNLSTTLKIFQPEVDPFMLWTNANSSVISKWPSTPWISNNTCEVPETSVDSSKAIENHSDVDVF
jgi:hypothetical protein